jgi:K+-transporting ATPase ATPase C chain
MKTLLIALRATVLTLVLTGLAYPALVTGAAQLLFPSAADGSVVSDASGAPVGSEIIAQKFARAEYFQPRPSAAGDNGYDPLNSGGSNLGPTSKKLRERVAADVDRLRKENPEAPEAVPAELVTTSGSGLDPDLSPEAARWQLPRIAKARGVAADRIEPLLQVAVVGRTLGFIGEPRVNVLALNLALDKQFGAPPALPPGPAAPPAKAPGDAPAPAAPQAG